MSLVGERKERGAEDPETSEGEEEEFEDANSNLNDLTRPSEWTPTEKVSFIVPIMRNLSNAFLIR